MEIQFSSYLIPPLRKGGRGDLIDMGQLIESLSISLYPKGVVGKEK